jgi:hypothetical protein
MQRTLLLASLAYSSISDATPLLASRAAAPGSIGKDCTNVRIDNSWLIGDCLTGTGTTRITSGTYMANKISNEDGILTWKEE